MRRGTQSRAKKDVDVVHYGGKRVITIEALGLGHNPHAMNDSGLSGSVSTLSRQPSNGVRRDGTIRAPAKAYTAYTSMAILREQKEANDK